MSGTLPREFFEELYAKSPDPFDFETSAYEAAKYQRTIATLPRARYKQAVEIGCSIGVLTSRLAEKCDSLLGIDISEQALVRAGARCAHLPDVKFVRLTVPEEFPDQTFDLIIVSEVAYYWSIDDLARSKDLIAAHQTAGGHLLLVHWLPIVDYHVQTGDAVHEIWLKDPRWRLVHGDRREQYRIDLLERSGE
jgi:predicted TPR repeat methyltransferase